MTRTFVLPDPAAAKRLGIWLCEVGHFPCTVEVMAEEVRTSAQNRRLQSMCADVAAQVKWHGQWLSQDDWRHIFVAALQQSRVLPGLDGGYVVLQGSSRRLSVSQMAALIELIQAFGADKGVTFRAMEEGDGEKTGAAEAGDEPA